jgi:very-short-patch-repair endonuclease
MSQLYNLSQQKPTRQYLRTHSTRAEIVLWLSLKGRQMLGYKFRRQYGIAHFILDFYCPELRLAIEVDGASHEASQTRAKDVIRQREIEKRGIYFLRFTDDQVLGSIEHVCTMIEWKIRELENHPSFPSLA